MSRPRQLAVYFGCVFAGTWGLGALMFLAPGLVTSWFGEIGVANPLFFAAVYVPSVTGVVLTAVFEGRAGLRALLGRLNPLGFPAIWYAIVLVGTPLVVAAGGLLTGGRPGFIGLRPALVALGVSLLLDPGPVGEELGWRGFALPRLLERWPPLTATVILGVIWGLWHIPAFLIPALPQSQMNFPLFVVGTVAISTVMTWCHVHTGGSVLIAILLHLMANHAGDIAKVESFEAGTVGWILAAAVIAISWRSARRRLRGPSA